MRSVAFIFLSVLHSSLALRILLTNEAGIDAHGLSVLRKALVAKGHKVSTFAPKDDCTAMGAALSMTTTVEQFGDPADDMWAVDGYPSTAVLVGLAQMERKPDLLISGVNVGYASGPMDIHSAAVAGTLTGLGKEIISFSILTNLSEDIDDDVHLGHAATFICHLVDEFVEGMVLFPNGVGLKIGYPALLPHDIPKVVVAGYGHYNPFSYGYYPSKSGKKGEYDIGPAPPEQSKHDDSDCVLVETGNIAVLPITNDISLHRTENNGKYLDHLAKLMASTDSRFEEQRKEGKGSADSAESKD